MENFRRYKVTYRLRHIDNADYIVSFMIEGGRIWQAQSRTWDDMTEQSRMVLGEFDARWIKRITVIELP